MAILKLTTCNDIVEATFIKDTLENENIRCFLANENFSGLMPGFTGMMGAGIQIMIEEEDYQKASLLLVANGNQKEVKCPNCNSTNVEIDWGKQKYNKIIVAVLSAFILTPFNNLKSNYFCKDCNCEF